MSKILISEPDGPYRCTVDTHVMKVEVHDCFTGILFETKEGEKLAINMRDGGFEIHYFTSNIDTGWTELKDGVIRGRRAGQPPKTL